MPSLYSRHPMVLQTAFAELKRQAMDQPFLLVGTPGSVGVRDVNGRQFLYRQFYDAQGRKSAEYIGPVGEPNAEARADAVREQIEITKGLLKEVRILAQQGYVRTDLRAGAILAALANHNLFRAGAVLVGSHAYGVLLNNLGVQGAAFFTEDVDIARNTPLKIALPSETGFLQMLRDSTVPLNPIPALDRKAPSTSYKPPGRDRLRVDLLVPAEGPEVTIREVPELKAHATALPYLRYLLADPADTVVMARECVVPVKVPHPERFAWHKMLVSQLRASSSEKRGKDVQQAAVLLAVLAEDAPDGLMAAFDALPASVLGKTLSGARQVLSLLADSPHERAVDLLRDVVAASGA